MLWGNTAYCAKLCGADLSRYYRFKKVSLCYSERRVTITNISRSFPHSMARKQLAYRYGMKKLRHCHPVYRKVAIYSQQAL